MRRFHLTLRWQLLLSYVPVILIPILITGLVVRGVAERSLSVLITQEAKQRAVAVSGVFIEYYTAHNNNWTGVEAVFQTLRPGPRPATNKQALPPTGAGYPGYSGNPQPAGVGGHTQCLPISSWLTRPGW